MRCCQFIHPEDIVVFEVTGTQAVQVRACVQCSAS